MGVYVEPKRGIHLQDATFYHLLDLPGLSKKNGFGICEETRPHISENTTSLANA